MPAWLSRRSAIALVAVLCLLTAPVSVSAAQAASAPAVIPALRNWTAGTGALKLGPSTRIVTADVATGQTLSGDLREQRGWRVPVVPAGDRPGDIVLRIDRGRKALGAQGYALTIGNRVQIVGATDAGVFYGTRTLLQMLTAGVSLPAGKTVDVPAFSERAVSVCACYTYYTDAWFSRLIKDMAYLKLNQLHLELKVRSEAYPGINFWSYYTKPEMRGIVALAARYHITVVPEINSPGHIDPYLKNYPDLQLVGTDGVPDPTRLDVTKPAAFSFLTGLINEYGYVFPGPYWHMGADEYMLGSAYQNYPQLLAYARAKFGPNAVAQDAYIDFINRVDAYVRSKGKTLRIWNDGLTSVATVPLNKDIIVEHWLETVSGAPTAAALVSNGYQVMNAAYDLYYVRGGFHQDTAKLYESGWTPYAFDSAANPPVGQPGVTGATMAVWPDNYAAETENSTQSSLYMPLRMLAQATWGSPHPTADYTGFVTLAGKVGHAPGWGPAWTQPLAAGTYTIRSPFGGVLVAPDQTVGSGLVIGSAGRWQLTSTSDGYYVIKSTVRGLCAEIRTGAKDRLGVPAVEGNPVTQQTCDQTRNTQKWQLERVPGGYRIVNAITQQALDASGHAVVQQPRPVAERSRWILTKAA